MLTSHVFF